MASNDIIGVNTNKLDKLTMDSFDYIEKIMSTLDNISAQMDKVSSCMDKDNANPILEKYNTQKAEYSNLKKILVTYTEQLISAKNSSYTTRDNLTDQIIKDSLNVNNAISNK